MQKKRVFEVFNSTRKYIESVGGIYENFSFVEVEFMMVAWLKGIYRENTVASSIFFSGNTQAPIKPQVLIS